MSHTFSMAVVVTLQMNVLLVKRENFHRVNNLRSNPQFIRELLTHRHTQAATKITGLRVFRRIVALN